MRRGLVTEAFIRVYSGRARLVLSLLFIALITVCITAVYEVGMVILFPNMPLWQYVIYDVVFAFIIAPVAALYVLLRFEGLYKKLYRESEERKRAEETLKLTQFALDNFTDSSMWFLKDGSIVYVNGGACRSLGYSREELLSKHVWDIDPSFPKEMVDVSWREKMQGRYNRFESNHVACDGRVFPVDVACSYIKYGDKEYLITFDRDITERKQAEKKLEVAKLQAELYLDLMGHDINNIDQIALGYLELAKSIPSGESQKEFIDKSMEALHRSTNLIGNVKKLQKIHNGGLKSKAIDVCKILAGIQREYGAALDKKIVLRLGECSQCIVLADELLHDVFSNLVINAIKHTGAGSDIIVGLKIIEDNGQRYCCVTVEDCGPGIPDSSKDNIFKRIHMGSSSGRGLGLYLVKSLMDSYGGRVWVEDRVKGDHMKGARFVVMLPAIENQ